MSSSNREQEGRQFLLGTVASMVGLHFFLTTFARHHCTTLVTSQKHLRRSTLSIPIFIYNRKSTSIPSMYSLHCSTLLDMLQTWVCKKMTLITLTLWDSILKINLGTELLNDVEFSAVVELREMQMKEGLESMHNIVLTAIEKWISGGKMYAWQRI